MNLNFAAYRQVLKSYVGILRWLWFAGLFFAGIVTEGQPMWLLWPALLLWLSWFVTLQVSWRIQTARGRLLPGYREVHLSALATVCGGVLVLLLGVMRLWPSDGAIAPVGLMLVAGAAGCWAALLPQEWGIGVLMVPAMAPLLAHIQAVPDVLSRWQSELAKPWPNLALAGAAAILLAEFWRRFWALTENAAVAQFLRGGTSWNVFFFITPDARAQREAVRSAAGAAEPGGLGGMLMRRADARFDAVVQRGSAGWAWNTRRWLLPSASVKLFVGILVVLFLIAAWCSPESGEKFAWFYLFLGPIVAASLTMALMMPRRRFLAIESLRPVTRGQFFRQLGAGVLAQSLTIALVIFAGLCLMLGLRWQGDWRTVELLGLVLGMLLVEMAMLLWLARFRRMHVAVAAAAGVVMLVVMLIAMQPWRVGDWVVAIAVVEIVAAVLAVWAVYRQWLVTDLD